MAKTTTHGDPEKHRQGTVPPVDKRRSARDFFGKHKKGSRAPSRLSTKSRGRTTEAAAAAAATTPARNHGRASKGFFALLVAFAASPPYTGIPGMGAAAAASAPMGPAAAAPHVSAAADAPAAPAAAAIPSAGNARRIPIRSLRAPRPFIHPRLDDKALAAGENVPGENAVFTPRRRTTTTVRAPDHELDFRGCSEAAVTARYIYIYLTGQYLNLAEVTAYDSFGAAITASAASLSSEYNGPEHQFHGPASWCIDGDTTTGCHSGSTSSSSLEIDLGSAQLISKVVIHNRDDHGIDRIDGATVSLYTGSGATGTLMQQWTASAGSTTYTLTFWVDILDTGVEGSGIIATAVNGATCSSDGMVFDGTDDYVDVTPWPFGGEPMTVEAYVKYDTFNGGSRIIDFADGEADDNVIIFNPGTSATCAWIVFDESSSTARLDSASSSFFEASIWVHVVATVEGVTMKLYKNGDLENTETDDGRNPTSLTRVQHWIGRSAWSENGYFDGTVAYLRFWHGEALDASQVAQLYAERRTYGK